MAKSIKKSSPSACPVCRDNEAVFFTEKNNCDLYRCKNCGLIFVWPISDDHLKIYQGNYFCGANNVFGYADYDGDKEIISGNFKKYLDKLDDFFPEKGNLLDVGAATGNFIKLAGDRGWTASGIEVSVDAVMIGKKNNLDMISGNFETCDLKHENYDVVTFWDVLEHFADPEAAFKKAQKILRTDGLMAINTPDSSSFLAKIFGKNWHLLVPPEHLNCFSLKGIEILCKRNNFEIISVDRIGKKFSLRYIFKILSRWSGFFIWKKAYDYLSENKLGQMGISLNTRDNFFIIAKKVN